MPFLSRIFSSRPGAPGEHDHGGPSHTNAGVESAGAAESSEAGQHRKSSNEHSRPGKHHFRDHPNANSETVNALPDETPTVGTSQVPERGNPAEDNHRHSRSGLDARRQSRMRSSRRSRYEISQAIRETDNEVRDLLAPHGLTPAALQEIHNRHSRLRNDVDRPLGVPIPIELPDESLMLANVATEDLPYMGTTVGAERVDMNEGHLPLSNPGNQVLGRVEQKVGRSPSHGRFSFLRKQSGRVKSMSGPGRCVSSSGEDEFGMPSKRKGNSARARPLSVDVINTCMTCGEKLTVPGHRTAYRCGRCKGVTDLEEKLDDILSKTLGEGFTTRGIWRVTAVPTNRPRNRPRNRPDVVYEEDEYDACESDVSDERM